MSFSESQVAQQRQVIAHEDEEQDYDEFSFGNDDRSKIKFEEQVEARQESRLVTVADIAKEWAFHVLSAI